MHGVFGKIRQGDPNTLVTLAIVAIVVLAVFLRLYNYFDRVNVHSDHSLFAQAAIFSAGNFTIPQIGPFAQSTFFTGPWWLWILAIFYLVPFGVLTPWFFILILSVGFVFLMYVIGREMGSKFLGFLAALFAAVSTAQISNSLSLWNAAADSLLACVALYFLIRFFKTKKAVFIFLLAFSVSLATTIHFQAGLLLPMVFVALITSRLKVANFIFCALGLVIPLVPFLIFDLRFNWFWVKSVWIWLTVDQYRFWVPNRWLTYAFDYWPQTWGYILGVGKWAGFLTLTLLSVLTLVALRDAKGHKVFFVIALSFLLGVVLFRYWGGEKFFYFSNFAHPTVFVLTAWVVVRLAQTSRYLGIALLILIIALAVKTSLGNLRPGDITYSKIRSLKDEIYSAFPGHNFDIYACSSSGALISHPLALLVYDDGRSEKAGKKIGVCYLPDKTISWHALTKEEIADANSWLNHSTERTYRTMTEWWKTNPPK